jgi:hypothetical protein
VVFSTYSYSSGAGIYAFSLCRNLNAVKGVFLRKANGKRAGEFADKGPDTKGVGELPRRDFLDSSGKAPVVNPEPGHDSRHYALIITNIPAKMQPPLARRIQSFPQSLFRYTMTIPPRSKKIPETIL